MHVHHNNITSSLTIQKEFRINKLKMMTLDNYNYFTIDELIYSVFASVMVIACLNNSLLFNRRVHIFLNHLFNVLLIHFTVTLKQFCLVKYF